MNIINLIKNNKIYIFVLIILILIFTIFFIDINTNDFDESIIKNKKEDSYVLSLR
jgi:preprotein translocase subunit SecY